MEPQPERYEIIGKAGQGGAGAVYKARDTQLDRIVALKRLLGTGDTEDIEGIGRSIAEEARTLASFSHPHIVTVFDVGTDADGAYVVMEFIDGETLDETVARAPFKADDFLEVAEQALEALGVAHSGNVLHRDLKPSNLMLTWLPSGKFQVKLLDFGLAKFSKAPAQQTMDQSNAILGSIYFMAPEQFERKKLTHRADLYSMGCLFYFCLTGRYPFDGNTAAAVMEAHFNSSVISLAELRPDLPPAVSDWVMWHLNVNPWNRPKSAKESLQTLRAALAGQSLESVGDVYVPPPRPVILSAHTSQVAVVPATARVPKLVTGQVATLRDSETGLVATKPGPNTATQAYMARVGSAKNDGRRRMIATFATVAGVLVAGLIAYGFFSENGPMVAQPVPPPVTDGLVAHFDAARETYSDGARTPAVEGAPVAEWGDLAPGLGGATPAQYHVTGTVDKEQFWPTLRTIPARDAKLPRPIRVLAFADGDRLKIGEIPEGDELAASLATRSVDIFVVARSRAIRGSKVYLFGTSAVDEEGEPLALAFDDGWGKFGPIGYNGHNEVAETRSPGRGFEIINARWDLENHSLSLDRTGSDEPTTGGVKVTSFDEEPTIRRLRLGDHWSGKAGGGTGFVGDIAEILIYNRVLPPAESSQVTEYLREKYFGAR